VYTTPVFGQEATDTNFYTIFPDPENEFKLHRHLAAIEVVFYVVRCAAL